MIEPPRTFDQVITTLTKRSDTRHMHMPPRPDTHPDPMGPGAFVRIRGRGRFGADTDPDGFWAWTLCPSAQGTSFTSSLWVPAPFLPALYLGPETDECGFSYAQILYEGRVLGVDRSLVEALQE